MQIRSNEELDLIENEKRIFTFDNVVIVAFSSKQKRKRQKRKNDKTKFKNFRENMKNLKSTMIDSLIAIDNTLTKIVEISKSAMNSRVDRLERNVKTLKMQNTEMLQLLKNFAQNTFKIM